MPYFRQEVSITIIIIIFIIRWQIWELHFTDISITQEEIQVKEEHPSENNYLKKKLT